MFFCALYYQCRSFLCQFPPVSSVSSRYKYTRSARVMRYVSMWISTCYLIWHVWTCWKENQAEKYPRLLFFFRKKDFLTFKSTRMPCKAAFFQAWGTVLVGTHTNCQLKFFSILLLQLMKKSVDAKNEKKKLASPPITERLDESFFFFSSALLSIVCTSD